MGSAEREVPIRALIGPGFSLSLSLEGIFLQKEVIFLPFSLIFTSVNERSYLAVFGRPISPQLSPTYLCHYPAKITL
jgi:hypothetical protein